MTIVRSPRPETHWTTFSNDLLRDERLSFAALGILTAVLSRPDNWATGVDRLTSERREGREVIARAMAELVSAGYVRREKRRGEDGRVSTYNVFYDIPQSEESEKPQVAPDYGLPQPGLPQPGLPTPGNPYPLRRNDLRKNSPPPAFTTSHSETPQEEENAEGGANLDRARNVLRKVCAHVPESRTPDAQQRGALVDLVIAALGQGWDEKQLYARLTEGDLNASQSVYAVLRHRLVNLPSAPVQAAVRRAATSVVVEPLPAGERLDRETAKRLIREKTQGSSLRGVLGRRDPVLSAAGVVAEGFQRLMDAVVPSPVLGS